MSLAALLGPAPRCWCGMHDTNHACPPVVHDRYKRSRELLERECTYRGAQPDMGGEHWDCHCGGTILVKVAGERTAA